MAYQLLVSPYSIQQTKFLTLKSEENLFILSLFLNEVDTGQVDISQILAFKRKGVFVNISISDLIFDLSSFIKKKFQTTHKDKYCNKFMSI